MTSRLNPGSVTYLQREATMARLTTAPPLADVWIILAQRFVLQYLQLGVQSDWKGIHKYVLWVYNRIFWHKLLPFEFGTYVLGTHFGYGQLTDIGIAQA